MSRSIRSVRFSRRSRPSSSRSSVVSAPGAPRPASISACRTQLRSAVSVRSSSRATAPMAFPLSRTMRTACALNSFVNARRFRLATTHSSRTFVRSEVSTKSGQVQHNGVIAWDAYEHGAGGRVVGMGPLGVEHPGELGFVCRGVVLDAVAYKKSKGVIPAGAEMLPIPTKPGDAGIVTADDVRGMLQMHGLRDIAPGACVALHTRQGNSWSNERYKSVNSAQRKAARDLFDQGEPGFGLSACEYLAARDIALTMCDTSACDAQPSGEQGPDFAVPCHTEMQTRRGIWNLENVDTKSLVDKKILEGAFIWAPLRIIGATGSPGNPMVLY